MKRIRLQSHLTVVGFTIIAIAFQLLQGAYKAGFGGHADEAAHYVTGLFVRDAGWFSLKTIISPGDAPPVEAIRRFVQEYYAHYPKIGLGVWPPVFYVMQSAWTALFSESRASLLVFMALLSGSLATLVSATVARTNGRSAGYAAGALFLSLPLVQQFGAMVMAEVLSTLWIYFATFSFAIYMETRRRTAAYAFGIFAALAILTKGTGVALGLLPAFAILLSGDWRILKDRSLWIAGSITAVLAGPWTVVFASKGSEVGGWEEKSSVLAYLREALPFFGLKAVVAIGLILLVLAVIGVWTAIVGTQKRAALPVCNFALVLAVLVFQSLVPASQEERHLLSIMPSLVYFAMSGCISLSSLVVARGAWVRLAPWILVVLFIAVGLLFPAAPTAFFSVGREVRLSSFRVLQKGVGGFDQVASDLLSNAGPTAKFIVSSDAMGEGMFISEIAMRDDRPGRTAERASKTLAASKWSGGSYQSRFEDARSVGEFLERGKYAAIVVDLSMESAKRKGHHELILRALEENPAGFSLTGTYTAMRGGRAHPEPIRVFSPVRPAGDP